MPTIMPAFDTFPKEGSIIGRLLAGYGELELSLCFCVAEARDDFDAVFKAMFRPRGEKQRIEIGDALGRRPAEAASLGQFFADTIGALKFCLQIRNRYAHCYWTDDFGRQLGFVDVEAAAEKNVPIADVHHIKPKWLDVPTLEAQHAYFLHTHNCLWWMGDEFRRRAGRSARSLLAKPKTLQPPPRDSPRSAPCNPSRAT